MYSCVKPSRAPVRPLVIRPGGTEALPVDLVIDEIVAAAASGRAVISGGPGSGKTVAIAHIAELVPLSIACLDEPQPRDRTPKLVISTCTEVERFSAAAPFILAPWGEDQVVEYLMSLHRGCCRDVMRWLLALPDLDLCEGCPELLVPLMEAAARGVRPLSVAEFLRGVVSDAAGKRLEAVRVRCLRARTDAKPAPDFWMKRACSNRLRRWLRHAPCRLLLASDAVLASLASGDSTALPEPSDDELIRACARQLKESHEHRRSLISLMEGDDRRPHASAMTLLHASGGAWRPDAGRVLDLTRARLASLRWPDVSLPYSKLVGADLSGTDLTRADFLASAFQGASLRCAVLRDARLSHANFARAFLAYADLSGADLGWAVMEESDLRGADLGSVFACNARFSHCNAAGARLVGADLRGALMIRVDLSEADLSAANLDDTIMMDLALRHAVLDGATFQEASLERCDLCDLRLTAPNFRRARLEDVDLTGTQFDNATLEDAVLRCCGLAEVHWEHANLRGADLRGSTFHAGSSRSGLIFSPIACEGSKTGFYTDEYAEQNFREIEQIRKANLRGSDLRGANVKGVDFYLVDLRDAIYDEEQARWFMRCGAILFDPA